MNKQMFLVHARGDDGAFESFVEYGEGHLLQRVEELVLWGYAANAIDIYTTVPYREPIEVTVTINKRFQND